jgi:hypothetical protein
MDITGSDWFEKKITDYWDQLHGAIGKFASRLAELDADGRSRALDDISACIRAHASALSNEWISKVAFVMADDLYKAVANLSQWHDSFPEYLTASAAVFCDEVSKRGYVIQYVVDNVFECSEFGMRGPLNYFETWFKAAGFVNVCPQHVPASLMDADLRQRTAYFEYLPQYIAEAREVALISGS